MITLTLRYPDGTLPRLHGEDAAKFVMDVLLNNPDFALKMATEVEVRGPGFKPVREAR